MPSGRSFYCACSRLYGKGSGRGLIGFPKTIVILAGVPYGRLCYSGVEHGNCSLGII